MTALTPAPAKPGPPLCEVCAGRLDPILTDGVHPNCAAAPQDVPRWRRDGAAWLARRNAARARAT